MDPKESCQCHLHQWFNIEGYVHVHGRKKIKKDMLSILLSLLDDRLEVVVGLRKNKRGMPTANCTLGDLLTREADPFHTLFIEVKISKDLTCG